MKEWTKKLGGGLAAVALMAGAVPGTVGAANAIEHGKGQMLDKGPRWPHKSIHFVELALGVAVLAGLVLLFAGGTDDPASP
ncbi:MAG TPA: hypothetical protein VFV30_07985 [Novosphingobium sp.]|nr:hypothetical protein [Novosphingobium sp.]